MSPTVDRVGCCHGFHRPPAHAATTAASSKEAFQDVSDSGAKIATLGQVLTWLLVATVSLITGWVGHTLFDHSARLQSLETRAAVVDATRESNQAKWETAAKQSEERTAAQRQIWDRDHTKQMDSTRRLESVLTRLETMLGSGD